MRRAARVVYSVRVYGEVLLHQKGERRAWDRTRRAGGGHGYEDELTSVRLRRAATHVAAALRVGVGRDGRRAADERRTGFREKDGEGGGGGKQRMRSLNARWPYSVNVFHEKSTPNTLVVFTINADPIFDARSLMNACFMF